MTHIDRLLRDFGAAQHGSTKTKAPDDAGAWNFIRSRLGSVPRADGSLAPAEPVVEAELDDLLISTNISVSFGETKATWT
jgi:hypothetical protein